MSEKGQKLLKKRQWKEIKTELERDQNRAKMRPKTG